MGPKKDFPGFGKASDRLPSSCSGCDLHGPPECHVWPSVASQHPAIPGQPWPPSRLPDSHTAIIFLLPAKSSQRLKYPHRARRALPLLTPSPDSLPGQPQPALRVSACLRPSQQCPSNPHPTAAIPASEAICINGRRRLLPPSPPAALPSLPPQHAPPPQPPPQLQPCWALQSPPARPRPPLSATQSTHSCPPQRSARGVTQCTLLR